MADLHDWIWETYQRLGRQGKNVLAELFRKFLAAYTQDDIVGAERLRPLLYELAEHYEEPSIRLIVDYYWVNIEAFWYGNLGKALDISTHAVVRLQAFDTGYLALGYAMQTTMMRIWLYTDGRGYVPEIIAVLDSLPESLFGELGLNFNIIRAMSLMRSDEEQQAMDLVTRIVLVGADSMSESSQQSLLGEGLYRIKRYEDSIEAYRRAVAAFRSLKQYDSADDHEMARCFVMTWAGRNEDALENLEAIRASVEGSQNRMHRAQFKAIWGKALVGLGRNEEAQSYLTEALDGMLGLGWLRDEAKIAVARLETCGESGMPPEWVADARKRVGVLRSSDIGDALVRVLGE